MFRFTRPLCQVLKRTTGIHGLAVHPDPLPALIKTYESTLSTLSSIPPTSVYKQSVEALVRNKLNIVKNASGDVTAAEQRLNEGQIEEALDIAEDELSLAAKMIEWKAYANFHFYIFRLLNNLLYSWEPLEEKPEEGQWEYAGKTTTAS
jgi:NADH dehydrogenase (ubiquinone) 1 alpha subcomplex subunit 5